MYDWRIMQANSQGLTALGVKTSYEKQIFQEKIFASGFQETRGNTTEKILQGGFVKLCSSGIKGQFGCQVWLNTRTPIGQLKGEDVYVNIDMCFIEHVAT